MGEDGCQSLSQCVARTKKAPKKGLILFGRHCACAASKLDGVTSRETAGNGFEWSITCALCTSASLCCHTSRYDLYKFVKMVGPSKTRWRRQARSCIRRLTFYATLQPFQQLIFSAFKTLTGQQVTIELKNDLAIQGTLKSVDQ